MLRGARVAQYRLALGKVFCEGFFMRTIRGTEQGAREAVEKLSSEGALGIVLASRGEHLRGATAAAKERNVAVIEAYDRVDAGDGVWSFALDPEQECRSIRLLFVRLPVYPARVLRNSLMVCALSCWMRVRALRRTFPIRTAFRFLLMKTA